MSVSSTRDFGAGRARSAAVWLSGMACALAVIAGGGARAQDASPPPPLSIIAVPPASSLPPSPSSSSPPSPSLDAVGILTPDKGGLGPTLWAGSSVELVRRLLADVPVAAPSPSQRRLTLRLLLSAAEPPAGDESGTSLAPLRVAKVAALGATTDLERLLAVMPGGRDNPVLATVLATAPAPGDPAGLAALARSEGTEPTARIEAAERAAATGALSGVDLAAAYASVQFAPAALARPLSASEPGARARALVYQATIAESQPAVRAELIEHWFHLLEPAQAVGPVAAVPLAVLARLPIEATTVWLAPTAVRAFRAAGQPEGAAPWLKGPATPVEAGALLRLWPLTVLAEDQTTKIGGSNGFDAWLTAALADTDAGRRARVAGVLALLQAAGEPVKEEAWVETADKTAGNGAPTATAMPSPALWQTLNAATAGHRVGEVVLAALTLLGNGGPQALPPVILAQVVTSLRAMGLSAEARGLAREAVAAVLE